MRRFIGRFLVFRTSALPKRIGVPVRRLGRKLLFKKQRVETTRQILRGEHIKVRAELEERWVTKTYSRLKIDMPEDK